MHVFERKLVIPDYSPYLIRSRLFSVLDDHHKISILSLISESGYGKTTFISSYVKEREIPTVWYQLDHRDRFPHVFLTYLKAGLSRSVSRLDADYVVTPEKVNEDLDFLTVILSSITEPLFIVFDDFHCIDQSQEIQSILNQLVANASPMVTFIMLSHIRPTLSPVKLKLSGRYKELKTADLAFTKSETFDFFQEFQQANLTDHEIDLIYQKTDGWPASYQLILNILENTNKDDKAHFWANFPVVSDIFEYLGTHIMNSQPSEIQTFLHKTSLLTELNPHVINEFLGIQQAQEILELLVQQQLFIYKSEHERFCYHPLFRQFLYQDMKRVSQNNSFEDDHIHIARIYESQHRFFHSFAHHMMGKNYTHALELIRILKDRYNPTELMTMLDEVLENSSPDLHLVITSFFLMRCIPAIFEEIIPLFDEGIAKSKEGKDLLWHTHLQHRLAGIYLFKGDFFQAKSLLEESLENSLSLHDFTLTAWNLNLLGDVCKNLGEFENAKQYARRSLYISEKYGIKYVQPHALDTIASIYLEEGDFTKAEPFIHQAIELTNKYDPSQLFFYYSSMSKIFRMNKDYPRSIEWALKAVEVSDHYGIEFDIGWSCLELGQCYLKNQQWKEAENYLSKALDALDPFLYYKALVIYAQIELYRCIGNSKEESRKVKQFVDICNKQGYEWLLKKLTYPEIQSIDIIERIQDSTITIHVLGKFHLMKDGKIIPIKRKSSLRLLQFFITHRNQKVDKDIIFDHLFEDGPFDLIRNQFNVALAILRKALEPDLDSGKLSRFITRSDTHYTFHSTDIRLDVEEFHMLSNSALESNSFQVDHLLRAEKLYQGDYFEEYPYESFLEAEREKLRFQYLTILRKLAHYYWDQQDQLRSIEYFEKFLNKDPYEENIYYEYLQLLLETNMTSQTKNLLNRMEKHLVNDLGITIKENLQAVLSSFDRSSFLKYINVT